MTAYGIAWCVVALAGGLLGVLAFRALRGLRSLRYLATALVFVCAVTPYGFDAEHTAPAFLVAAFRLPFVDETADPTGAVMALGAVSAGVLLAYLVVMPLRWLVVAKRRNTAPEKNVE